MQVSQPLLDEQRPQDCVVVYHVLYCVYQRHCNHTQVYIEQEGELEKLVEEARKGSKSLQAQLAAQHDQLEKVQLAEAGQKARLQVKTDEMAKLQIEIGQLTKVGILASATALRSISFGVLVLVDVCK